MDLKEVVKLLELMEDHGLDEVEVEQGDTRIKLRKSGGMQMAAAPMMAPMAAPMAVPMAANGGAVAAPAPEAVSAPDDGTTEITSPMVGTFYRSAAPDADSFVNEGDTVTAESVICIIEAMKVMNEIRAEAEGEIVKILVENGESVEFGQPLMLIRKPQSA